jgi:hypothetical protein
LLIEIDEPHRAAFEAEVFELVVVDFEEDIDDGVAETAELEFACHILKLDLTTDEHR